ncbi:MAG: isocitrate lyase/PEP mutase family protein [Halapricum sp.]
MGLKERLQEEEILLALGGYDAISAKMAYQAGAEAVYMSGSSVATSVTGEPDVGLATMTEMANRAHQMAGAIDVPLVADADTGYGNPLNVRRTVTEYERAGVNAIQIEDQTFPKRCGHFEGKSIVPAEEFVQKIRAATDARESEDFLIIARTDALAVEGVDEAIDRANRYKEAGADVLFVESPRDREEMERITDEAPGLHLANMAPGGLTPVLPADELQDIGYDITICPADAFRAALQTFEDLYSAILEHGSQEPVLDDMVDWEHRNEITGLDRIGELEERYAQD